MTSIQSIIPILLLLLLSVNVTSVNAGPLAYYSYLSACLAARGAPPGISAVILAMPDALTGCGLVCKPIFALPTP